MAMQTLLGPIPINQIILCAADAGPSKQQAAPDRAEDFFPRAPWVGAVRDTAARVGCRFVILTTGHGLVRAKDVITPYDLDIRTHGYEAGVYCRATVPAVLHAHRNELLIFYAGGSPREPYLDCLLPNLRPLGISVLTFGRPSLVDAEQLEPVVHKLSAGTSLEAIAAGLAHRNRLQFYYQG